MVKIYKTPEEMKKMLASANNPFDLKPDAADGFCVSVEKLKNEHGEEMECQILYVIGNGKSANSCFACVEDFDVFKRLEILQKQISDVISHFKKMT